MGVVEGRQPGKQQRASIPTRHTDKKEQPRWLMAAGILVSASSTMKWQCDDCYPFCEAHRALAQTMSALLMASLVLMLMQQAGTEIQAGVSWWWLWPGWWWQWWCTSCGPTAWGGSLRASHKVLPVGGTRTQGTLLLSVRQSSPTFGVWTVIRKEKTSSENIHIWPEMGHALASCLRNYAILHPPVSPVHSIALSGEFHPVNKSYRSFISQIFTIQGPSHNLD